MRRSAIFYVALFTLHFSLCLSALAQQRPYVPAGSPPAPKVTPHWNKFHSYDEAAALLQQLAKLHPERCRLQSLGKSFGNREMWLLTITNFKSGDETKKPAFWIDGGIHANELQAVDVTLYTAWYLLEMDGHNEFITNLLNERVFYIMPMMSPDSRDAHMTKPNTTHSPRTGMRPVDDDRDGLFDEDHPDDLDGDGHITQMRIKDPNGRYKPHDEMPNLLVRVKDEEKGLYTLLGTEGIDNDGDGRVNEDSDGFYDPNRDWPWNWQPEYVQRGAHTYPFSIPENRMMADFVMSRPNIAGSQSYHNTGGMILRGPGAKDDRYDDRDLAVMSKLGTKGELMLPGYRYINTAEDLYEVYGGECDWFYAMLGAISFTNELFTPFNYFRKADPGAGWFGRDEERHTFNKLLLFDDGFVKWKEVDHPTYGRIEVGGYKKNWTRQPPGFLIEEELHRNMAFTLYHADQMPRVKVQKIDVLPLGDGLKQVTATIENTRLTPTHTQFDLRNSITPPDIATLSGADGKELQVILGFKTNNLFDAQWQEQKRKPEAMKLRTIGGNDVVYVRWLVSGAGPFKVKVVSVKGGVDEKAQPE
ncbi:MAG: M14 family metallopeptidase [Phycisphaeraceae bacterium]